jgi:hypothetical protein
MVVLYYLALVLALAVAGVLGYAFVSIRFMGEGVAARNVRRARKLVEEGKPERAVQLLYKTLRTNGWDYEAFLAKRDANRPATIKEFENPVIGVFRQLKLIPANNLPWMIDAFFALAAAYEKQNLLDLRNRLYVDLNGFVEQYGGGLGRVERSKLLSDLDYKEAEIELAAGNIRGAAHLETAGFLRLVEHLHAKGERKRLRALLPYRPSEALQQALAKLGREADAADVVRIVQRAVVDGGARIAWARVARELDDFFMGRVSQTDRDREIAQLIYRRMLDRAAGREADGADDEY